MVVRPRGFIVVFSVVCVLSATGAGSAFACDEPTVSLDRDAAGPGDDVGFTIANLEEGARFYLYVEKTAAASGTQGAQQGYRGSFAMPDFGSDARTLYINVYADHEGQEFFNGDVRIHYVPAEAASKDKNKGSSDAPNNDVPDKAQKSVGNSRGTGEPTSNRNADSSPPLLAHPARGARATQSQQRVQQSNARAEQKVQGRGAELPAAVIDTNARARARTAPVVPPTEREEPSAAPASRPGWLAVAAVLLLALAWLRRRGQDESPADAVTVALPESLPSDEDMAA